MDNPKTVKIFTLEEANRLLPQISEGLERTAFLFEKLRSLTRDIEDLQGIWGRDVNDPGNPDYSYYFEKIALRERAVTEINDTVAQINKLGCIVKDAEAGLVDFYFDNNGQLVFLCWRIGERCVEQWHPVEGGFRTRQHIDKMK